MIISKSAYERTLEANKGPLKAPRGSFGASLEPATPSKSNRCSCLLFFKEFYEILTDFQANRSRGLTKLKIPLQLYDRFVFNMPFRRRGVTKCTFEKQRRSRGVDKTEDSTAAYHHFDAKTCTDHTDRTAAAVGCFHKESKIFTAIFEQTAREG